MPGFGGATPIVTAQAFVAELVGYSGETRSTGIGRPPTSVTKAQYVALANAIGEVSNMGLFRWQGGGDSQQIPIRLATAYDELHDENRTLIVTFQDANSTDQHTARIPAPDAGLFVGGVRLNDPSEDTRIQTLVSAFTTVLNAGGANYGYASGYLDSATAAERRKRPMAAEPASGTDAEFPGPTDTGV
jgi:hypothetical protein